MCKKTCRPVKCQQCSLKFHRTSCLRPHKCLSVLHSPHSNASSSIQTCSATPKSHIAQQQLVHQSDAQSIPSSLTGAIPRAFNSHPPLITSLTTASTTACSITYQTASDAHSSMEVSNQYVAKNVTTTQSQRLPRTKTTTSSCEHLFSPDKIEIQALKLSLIHI